MKTLPMMFTAAMVRAILDGRKTETGRVVNLRDLQTPSATEIRLGFRSPRGPPGVAPSTRSVESRLPLARPRVRPRAVTPTLVSVAAGSNARQCSVATRRSRKLNAPSRSVAFRGAVSRRWSKQPSMSFMYP